MTRLLIVSDTPHHRRGAVYVGHGSTVREIDHLATLFDEVHHVGFLWDGAPPISALPYAASNVSFVPLRAAGGAGLGSKLRVLAHVPGYAWAIARQLGRADALHVRCPAIGALLAMLMVAPRHRPRQRWFKYAGSWAGYRGESASYRFQRWWLRRGLHRGVVSVNGTWPRQAAFVRTFPNPCLTDEELRLGVVAAAGKPAVDPLRVLFVGGLTQAKGADTVVRAAAVLRRRGCRAIFDLVGDGALRTQLEALRRELDVVTEVRLLGARPRSDLGPLYANAHVTILPSRAEGWPKVLSEGMAYGAVPVAGAVGSIPYYLARYGTGACVASTSPEAYADVLEHYARDGERWRQESVRAVSAAPDFGFSRFLDLVRPILTPAPAATDASC